MKILLACFLAAMACATVPSHAQTTLATSEVLVCPVPLWPSTPCPKTPVFSVTTNTANAAASVSKTAPVWQHTFAGYAATDLVVVCPVGAIVSTDATKCTTTAGADASVLIAASAVNAAAVPPVTPPPPANVWVPMNWTCAVANGVATCTAPIGP